MIVSFARTVSEIEGRIKDVTRRLWTRKHAAWFKPGRAFEAWTAGPHRGGQYICRLVVVSCRREPLATVGNDGELVREGGRWKTAQEFAEMFGIPLSRKVYRLEFKYDESVPPRAGKQGER